jgi:hypothetical protein
MLTILTFFGAERILAYHWLLQKLNECAPLYTFKLELRNWNQLIS